MQSILTNSSAITALGVLRSINKDLSNSQQEIATGLRVSTASDNAAYWSIATTMRADIRAAERELGIRRDDASRAVKVASLPEEVKNAAREVGLDDNRSALLEAAKHEGIENQIASIRERAEAKVMRLADDPLNDESGKTDTVSDLKQAGSQIRNGCENHQETRHRVGFPGA